MVHRVYICANLKSPFDVQDCDQLDCLSSFTITNRVHFQEGEHCWLLPMCASADFSCIEQILAVMQPSMPALCLVSANLLQDSIEKDRVRFDQGAYVFADNSIGEDALRDCKYGHVTPHNILSSHIFHNLVFLRVVQGHLRAQTTPRTAFRQEGEDDEDMTPIHMSMRGAWGGEEGDQQGFPSQEEGPRLIRFESPRWRPKETQVRVHLGVQEQPALNSSPRSHTGSVFDVLHMLGKLRR